MQALVAGILRAMGYKTKISQECGDRGKDVIASPDGLGLTQPRIFVEVKHRKGQMGAPEVRKFIGGRNPQNDRCLFVSTGGFTTEAKYEAERSIAHLTLIDSDDLVELLVEYYEKDRCRNSHACSTPQDLLAGLAWTAELGPEHSHDRIGS